MGSVFTLLPTTLARTSVAAEPETVGTRGGALDPTTTPPSRKKGKTTNVLSYYET